MALVVLAKHLRLVYTTELHFLTALESGNWLSGRRSSSDKCSILGHKWLPFHCVSLGGRESTLMPFFFSFLSFVVLGIDFSQLISDRKPRVTVTKDMDFGETLGLRGKFEAV